MEEELAWIRDKEPLVKSDDLGRTLLGTKQNEVQIFANTQTLNSELVFKPVCLVGVQNLIKKQEVVDAEITAHEQLINTVLSTADQLIEREHYAADEIEARCADLQEKWAELTSLSATRQQNLQESQKAQQVRKRTVQSAFELSWYCLGKDVLCTQFSRGISFQLYRFFNFQIPDLVLLFTFVNCEHFIYKLKSQRKMSWKLIFCGFNTFYLALR